MSLGPTVSSAAAVVVGCEPLLPLSRDGVQIRGIVLTRWGGDRLLKTGQSGKNIGSFKAYVGDLAHKSALVSGLPKILGGAIKTGLSNNRLSQNSFILRAPFVHKLA